MKKINPFKIRDTNVYEREIIFKTLNRKKYCLLDHYPWLCFYYYPSGRLTHGNEGFDKNSLPEITYTEFYNMYVEKYFRLNSNAINWEYEYWVQEYIFPGSYIRPGYTVSILSYTIAYPEDWEEVTYEDWLEQEQTKKNHKSNDTKKIESAVLNIADIRCNADMILEQFEYRGFTFQQMTKDARWYVCYANQIVNWGQYVNDLKEWVDSHYA